MKSLIAIAAAFVVFVSVDAATPGSLAALSTQPSMNVFRRFAVDAAKMTEFYGDVLGLRSMPPIRLGPDSQMIRFQVGTAEIKLQATRGGRQLSRRPGARGDGPAGLHLVLPG